MTTEKRRFEAEVSRLLEIVAHSLYSEREIFLRELISNASDACDRLRYLALTQPELVAGNPAYHITLAPDAAARTLTIADNGIGMSRDELIENIGTIARSGTSAFVRNLSGDQRKDVALIGQFGVGFYSAFMVADKVEVLSLKAGESQAHLWVSDGKGDYTVDAADKETRGTVVILHLKDDAAEFTEPARLREIVKRHSDHIAVPIVLHDKEHKKEKDETINAASALWLRPKSEITSEQYREFYHHVGHSFDEPWLTIHNRAEGMLEYTSLLFVPSSKPFDLFDPERKHRVKLYVKRVFVTDDCQPLLPAYLRFLKGIVDSEDLPLNVSREMLQSNPMLTRMRTQITKRVLGELAKKAKDASDEYAMFWNNFGSVLKEGLYEDRDHRDELLQLVRFRTTGGDGLVSLEDYVARMKPGQTAIYTISGDAPDRAAKSPQIEGFRARGVEVLLLTDPVDEFWLPALGAYKDKPFKSVTRGAAELNVIAADGKDKTEAPTADTATASLIALMKLSLGDTVKDVRISTHLTDSAVCLVADEGDLDMRLERLLRQHNRLDQSTKRILEVNPKHLLIARLAELAGKEGAATVLGDFAWVLLDQARILEGEQLPDPAAFARRLSELLAKGLGGA